MTTSLVQVHNLDIDINFLMCFPSLFFNFNLNAYNIWKTHENKIQKNICTENNSWNKGTDWTYFALQIFLVFYVIFL